MANTIKTLSAGDITRKALAILHNNLVFCKNINRDYDSRFAVSGAKNGGTLLIRNPNEFTIRTGAVMDTQDLLETTQTLTIATQKGVDINFSSLELTLSLDEFADRILEPAMSRLAAEVDKDVIEGTYVYVNNVVVNLAASCGLTQVGQAKMKISQNLAPSTNRYFMTNAGQMRSLVSAGVAYLNPTDEISKQYRTGLVGQYAGFQFYESEMTPDHLVGSRTDTTPTVSTTNGFTSGTATIQMTSNATGTDIHAGDHFQVAGVYFCNPETKVTSALTATWAVTTQIDVSTSACSIAVSPTPYTSGAKQNCVIATAGATNSVSHLINGTTSITYNDSIAWHRDAFTMVTADLEMPNGVDFARREVFDGISLRLVRQYDIVNDKFPCRIDVLFGHKCLRPGWACIVRNLRV